jgi:hypothetical protein
MLLPLMIELVCVDFSWNLHFDRYLDSIDTKHEKSSLGLSLPQRQLQGF